jgi:hypothetical protein
MDFFQPNPASYTPLRTESDASLRHPSQLAVVEQQPQNDTTALVINTT